MKIYTDHLDEADVHAAFLDARVKYGQDIHIAGQLRRWKPRKEARGIEVWGFAMQGRNATGWDRDLRAPSWEAWGYVIALLFNKDPFAKIGNYNSEPDFIAKMRQQKRHDPTPFLETMTNIREYDE